MLAWKEKSRTKTVPCASQCKSSPANGLIFQINQRTIRYGELKRAIPNISEKMLIDELKFLCDKGLVKKEQYPEVPPRVEYSLTELGEKVLPIIDEIAKFGMENL